QYTVAKNSIGTDYGVRFARSLECARLPIANHALTRIVNTLNPMNENLSEQFNKNGKTYEWDGLTNNCSHVASQILNAAGIRDTIPSQQSKVQSVFNIAIPRNGLYTLLQIGLFGSMKANDVFTRKSDRR